MGQLESCLKEGESRGLQAQLEKQQPTSFNVKLEPLLPEVINEVVDVHAVSQYSSLLAKLKHYNKKELTKVLVSQPLPQVHMRSLQGQVRKGGGTAPSLKDSGHLLRQDKQKRQLESLKQECARIDHLRRQLVRKSRRMQEQDGGKNHVHGHQPIFASTHRPQSASPSPTP